MSDKEAWNAPRGIDGAIHWITGVSELHYARYVNGEERKAEYVELDGVKFVSEQRIAELEKLVRDMFADDKCFRNKRGWYRKRMEELGIEVES